MKDRIPRAPAIIPALVVLSCIGSAASTVLARASSSHRGIVSCDEARVVTARRVSPAFLGFGLGEERRYVLGPVDELYRGEEAMWSIRLREVLADPHHAVFELSHEWGPAAYRSEPPIGTTMHVSSSGELRVNAYGFPLDLRFRTDRQLHGLGEQSYAVRYAFEDGDFRKFFSVGTRDFDHPVRVRRTDELDVSVPRGMWAHAPMALECMFPLLPSGNSRNAVPNISPNAGSGGRMSATPFRLDDPAECREPLFANPGLLSLMLPTLWEEGIGELDFLMLTPAGDFGMPGPSVGAATMGSSGGVSVAAGTRPFDADRAIRPQTNSEVEDLHYVDRVRVEVGPRAVDAWRFEGMRDFDSVFVDDDGVVVRVDLSTTVSSAAAGRSLWIRLLFPSEY